VWLLCLAIFRNRFKSQNSLTFNCAGLLTENLFQMPAHHPEVQHIKRKLQSGSWLLAQSMLESNTGTYFFLLFATQFRA
jgi:hypothetical protein